MNCVKIDLPKELKEIQIYTLADLHLGDAFCDYDEVKRQIKTIAETPNAYAILNGDLMNNATKTSISDCYAEQLTPMQQLGQAYDLLSPIKDKILSIQSGNHEKRTYHKEGIDLTELLARELKLTDRYSKAGNLIFIRFGWNEKRGRKHWYSIYANHGSGGGRKEGAKAIRLADMAAIVDADIYIHSHTHLPMIMKQGFYRVDNINSAVQFVTKLFVNTASALKFGGYGEEYEHKPSSTHAPVIYLSGVKKRADARL